MTQLTFISCDFCGQRIPKNQPHSLEHFTVTFSRVGSGWSIKEVRHFDACALCYDRIMRLRNDSQSAKADSV